MSGCAASWFSYRPLGDGLPDIDHGAGQRPARRRRARARHSSGMPAVPARAMLSPAAQQRAVGAPERAEQRGVPTRRRRPPGCSAAPPASTGPACRRPGPPRSSLRRGLADGDQEAQRRFEFALGDRVLDHEPVQVRDQRGEQLAQPASGARSIACSTSGSSDAGVVGRRRARAWDVRSRLRAQCNRLLDVSRDAAAVSMPASFTLQRALHDVRCDWSALTLPPDAQNAARCPTGAPCSDPRSTTWRGTWGCTSAPCRGRWTRHAGT